MDEYDKKFAEMQKYIPFLEAMIERLQNVKDKSREVQLQKMQSLHGILSNSKRKLKIETLQRCEDVLQKLHNKVEKGNTPGLHFPNKKGEQNAAQSSTASEDASVEQNKLAKKSQQIEERADDRQIHETPASPSPPVSPDSGTQAAPIIIPTERSVDLIDDKTDSKPASPDPIETLPTKAPIIIPTERMGNPVVLSPSSKHSLNKNSDEFAEWEMLEESEKSNCRSKSWQSVINSGQDVAAAAMLVGNSLPQKLNEGRPHVPIAPRHIPTVPVPSLGGSRRLSSVLEKNRLTGLSLDINSSDSRSESPVNVPDVRLKSPDPDILFSKHKNTSPRLKDIHVTAKTSTKPPAPLLLSPPPVSTEPPLSMEDLAELLNEESDGKTEKINERLDEAAKFKKDTSKQESSISGINSKDGKASKSNLLSQEDIDRENERRWEEIDKHIVKLTSRKCLPSIVTTTPMSAKVEALKSNELKGPPPGASMHSSSSFLMNIDKAVDNRNRPPSPGSKSEPRYADNYERHPRQPRDNHSQDNLKDKTNLNLHCRLSDDDIANQIPVLHNGGGKAEDRNTTLYQRRQANIGPEIVPPRIETEFRMDGPDYFNRQLKGPSSGHWPPIHPPVNANDFCNNQWPPPANFNNIPTPSAQPVPYQHPMGMQQEMWNVGATGNPIHMDTHPINDAQLRSNQFPPSINPGIRPLMSPTARPPDMNHAPRPDNIPNVDIPSVNVPAIPPLLSPTSFPPQYRNFQGENRPYEPPFDRGMEYPHMRQPGRANDVSYRGENEVPCGIIGADGPAGSAGPYPRPSTPCPWNRDRDRCNRGRGRDLYYNDRNRGESRSNFNRDTRRPEWPRDSHNEWDSSNRFHRDARNLSERDPRVRMEHNVSSQSPNQPRDSSSTSARDPRLAKDKHVNKSKDSSFNERNPRKRSTAPPPLISSSRKSKEKTKSPPKSSDNHKRSDPDRHAQEKAAKDKMQSPLESLYGVIDTKAKSAQGYCLQNFKIPKIKRTEPLESPSPSQVSDEVKSSESNTRSNVADKQDEKSGKSEVDKDDTIAEVSSSSDGNILQENWSGDVVPEKKEDPKEETVLAGSTEITDKDDVKVGEADSISPRSSTPVATNQQPKKDDVVAEGSKPKEEVTQEWIEALIRKSFEFGEGKKFVEQAKLMQKLGEVLQTKKLKKIKKIIESETESSSSDKDETIESKKTRIRKKRRVIVSDSSDEETLAERLGILNASTSDENQQESIVEDQKSDANTVAEEVTSNTKVPKDDTVKVENSGIDDPQVIEPDEPKAQESLEKSMENVEKNDTDAEDSKDATDKNETTEDDKDDNSKTPKTKAKRRNSLEMLQEDIREMFISEGVVTATGHRMCRVQKEKDDTPKPKSKTKKETPRLTRQRSKQYVQSSDSEEDQPLALRTELMQSSTALPKQDEPATKEESEALRKSRRVLGKDAIKEPRVVVEKTDISKFESAKVMFDSSSDESFGIDVSELAAAVDISLHTEKQPESSVPEPVEKKKYDQVTIKKTSKKKASETLKGDKVEDISFTDEESVTSDISMSSSITSAKKVNVNTMRTETGTNEELLSNILVGLAPAKPEVEKDTVVDKGSDADVDDDTNDQLPIEQHIKKSSTKKKKKKCWQLGILSKKKKKRASTASSAKVDSDVLNTSSEVETSTKMDSSSILEDKTSNETSAAVLDNMNETVCAETDISVKGANSDEHFDTPSTDEKVKDPLGSSATSDISKGTPTKTVSSAKEESSEVNETKDVKPIVPGDETSKKSEIEEKIEENDRASYNIDEKNLINYAWTGQERYKCLLCFFVGKNIVHHYKTNHTGKEILISRLNSADAQIAIQDAKDYDTESMSKKPLTDETCKFHCRFCSFFTEGIAKIAIEAFYEHCTTHTGEYRFRCNSCPYQAVARSSMRTHYYKVCRKFKGAFSDAITEDKIPEADRVYGYLCSSCNFVQLIKSNVLNHICLWHKDDSDTKVIVINMALDMVTEELDTAPSTENEKVESEPLVSTKLDESVASDNVTVNEQTENEVIDVESVNEKPCKVDVPTKQLENDEESKSSLPDVAPVSSGNLSVFVCPPELEKKEVEIQLERKRKMQEIIENIGIKLQKNATKKGISIIDKLKDKMKTNLQAVNIQNESNVAPESPTKEIATNPTVSESPIPAQSSPLETPTIIDVFTVKDSGKVSSTTPLTTDRESDNSADSQQPNTEESQIQPEAEKSDIKVRDPLTTMDEKKNYESEVEVSDNENTGTSAPVYESDSSSEQSDTEPPTDVNMILKETSSINASSKDPMLTTIQRLAAQLKAAKPLDSSSEDSRTSVETSDKSSSSSGIPKPPNVVPIASIKRFVRKLNSTYHDVSSPETQSDDSNTPKNFIRLRRLSGDMLSVPVQPSELQEDGTSTITDGKSSDMPSKAETILHTDGEEECSFLKIENVVSLAPRGDNDGAESPIIHDIRKAVETSPIKSKGVSLLKKSNSPLILKRLNAVAITQPLAKNLQSLQSKSETVKLIPLKTLPSSSTSATATTRATSFIPIAPKSKIIQVDNTKLSFPISVSKNSVIAPVATRTATATTNVNYKILKVVRTPTVLKSKEPAAQPTAIKLKSADAYKAMLQPIKLTHLYKCMARDCRFSSDLQAHYHQHYLQHLNECELKKSTPPYDFQKCAYCYMALNDWNQMKLHMEEKHAHCRYQCNYCFYRAIVPSYVQMHQTVAHPGHHGILLGKFIKEIPLKEEVNRHDCIHPFVCPLECGKFFYVPEAFIAHLKSKHMTVLAILKCHLCRATCIKIDQLISHYKTHGFYKYQCLYCLNGSDTFNDMHSHLSAFHCNRLPQVLERSLPPQPTRSKDVIDQLIVRCLDENLKPSDEINITDITDVDSNESICIDVLNTSPPHTIAYPQLPKEITMLDKEENEALNKSMSNLFGNKNSNANTSSVSALVTQQEKQPGESVLNKTSDNINNEANLSITSTSEKQSMDKNLSDKSAQNTDTLVSGAVMESQKPSEKFDCSDEFINVNLLDNPTVVRSGSNCPKETSFINNNPIRTEDKTEDSDIEIVDIDDTETTVTKNEKVASETNKTSDSTKTKGDTVVQKTDAKDQSISNSANTETASATAASTSNILNKSTSNAVTQSDKPLTLEDIKDTGFTGMELYKCGYETCDHGAQTPALLRSHVKDCSFRDENKNLNCVHCNKRFMKIGFLLEHLKLHGLKRFGCSLCKMRCTVGYQAMAHMKAKHKIASSKLVPADPKNPSADGLFIVQPINQTAERKGKKRKSTKSSEKESDKGMDIEKLSFSPDEIEQLPRQAIYNREVQCAVCPYTTKVRTNIIRHLQLHAKDESVPESGPVNPVPCLDKKERMFDKMVNLASSSHQNGRMGGKTKEPVKDEDDEFIPKYVPEHKRYVCGVAECNYLTVDEAMLRYHLKALHSEEPYFRCPHCPQPQPGQEGLNIAIDKMAVHLKMHDTRLYKCSHCNNHHYHRHVVERHLTDKHPEKRPYVKVIRELESTENTVQPIQEETEEEVPDPDGNHWKCNICEYKCVYKAEMATHASTTHDEKSQFKCTLCSFKTSGKIMFEQHVTSKHTNDSNVDYVMTYQRIKGVNKKSADNVDQVGQEEPFDTTPLWRRDMPRIRHIRGILLEEEDAIPAEPSLKGNKRRSDTELLSSKPAKIKPGKSGSLDDNKQSKEKSKRSMSCEKIATESENSKEGFDTPKKSEPTAVSEKPVKETKIESVECGDPNDSDVGRFGPYGKPDGNMYVCTLCTQFKTKYKHDMRDHLYRELNYARWHCKECGYLSVNRNALLKHFAKHHHGERPDHEPLSPDDDIEEWVGTLLKKQTVIIKGSMIKQNTANTESTTTIDPSKEKVTTGKASQSTVSKAHKVDLTHKLSTVQNTTIDVDAHDNDSKDNEALIIDTKEEGALKTEKRGSLPEADKSLNTSDVDKEKPLTCKHCKMIFTRWRGFKLHVQLTHLKRLGFICPYCDRSTNSESLMRQHIKSKHPGCPEEIVENPAAGGPELTDEFWQKEYGIVFPKKSNKKRKRKMSTEENVDNDNDPTEIQGKCNVCGFTAMNLTGLRAHMRIHAPKCGLQCKHCIFSASTKVELWKHWELKHPLKLEETVTAGSSGESGSTLLDKSIDAYSDEIEEEQVTDTKNELVYCCFYCSVQCQSLESLKQHWSNLHKESKLSSDPAKLKTNFPFKYTVSVPSQQPMTKCLKTETESPYELYLQQSQDEVQVMDACGAQKDGWICQWCNEFCDSEAKMKAHHNMFHSHLPLNFKKQGSDNAPKGYRCPECMFTTTFINIMKTHVSKHINLFKCKYCDKTFSSPTHVSSHNAEEHPKFELKIESIQNYDVLIDKIMTKVKWLKAEDEVDKLNQNETVPIEAPKNNAVAKKSTAKSTVRVHPIHSKVKAVARKSTNPYSRYLPNVKSNDADKQKLMKSRQFSYYGVPRSPVNLTKLNTYMVVGGHRMKVNCTTLAQLININPKIVLTDLKYNLKNAAALSQLKT